MTRQLMSLMRLASKYNWPAVLSFNAAVLDRIEAGLANWGNDFSEIERFNITESQRLPNTTPSANNAIVPGLSNRSRLYCHGWNRTGACHNTSHQPGVEHICAYCKLSDHTIASFPTRPPPSSNRPTPPTSDWPVISPNSPERSPLSLNSPLAPLPTSEVPFVSVLPSALLYPFVCRRCSPYPFLQVVIPQRLRSSCSRSFEIEYSFLEICSRQVLRFCSGRFSRIWLAHQLPLKFRSYTFQV